MTIVERIPTDFPEGKVFLTEYFRNELKSDIRHEYKDGILEAMAGASARHNATCGYVNSQLFTHLRGKPCKSFSENLKCYVQLDGKDRFYYPDVMVTCKEEDNHPYFRYEPKFLVEVLSKDEDKDKVEKLEAYQQIPSLEEYLIIKPNPKNREALLYSRSNNWEDPIIQTSGILKITALDFDLDLDDLYTYLEEIPESGGV